MEGKVTLPGTIWGKSHQNKLMKVSPIGALTLYQAPVHWRVNPDDQP